MIQRVNNFLIIQIINININRITIQLTYIISLPALTPIVNTQMEENNLTNETQTQKSERRIILLLLSSIID